MSDPRAGQLVLVTTPIGNARDITLRGLDLLREADVLVAEDTRSLRRLMDIHGVPVGGRPLLAYHDHSGAKMRDKVLSHLALGALVVYASEAGTPLIADPGYDLVQVARAAGHGVTSAPGPSAAVTALSIAGLPTDRFFFEGFMPSAKGARRKVLQSLVAVPGTLIFYESPKRLEKSLGDMAEILGEDRAAVVARELTKRFEEIRAGTLAELCRLVAETPPKGEIVILVGPAPARNISPEEITRMLTAALASQSAKDAVAEVTAATGAPRRQVYKQALAILGKS
ncbi:16S rRNA (cytidine(1402)-2'-O)-methyltransferase [Dinoroseobacter sp. S76]|uniref:16S rRNA (cytidine(1402)-2'-O)-methyltransferase n=1 Tax=Dinoroseobacter sp. S76 TaxID=3415124 RepID=UPI003C7E0A00